MEVEPLVYDSMTMKIKTACGNLYVTMTFLDDGKLWGILGRLGRAGGCGSLSSEVTCGLLTEAIRAGADPERLIRKTLLGTQCHVANPQGGLLSCADAFAVALLRGLELENEKMGRSEGEG